jgi:hypothetical protein
MAGQNRSQMNSRKITALRAKCGFVSSISDPEFLSRFFRDRTVAEAWMQKASLKHAKCSSHFGGAQGCFIDRNHHPPPHGFGRSW